MKNRYKFLSIIILLSVLFAVLFPVLHSHQHSHQHSQGSGITADGQALKVKLSIHAKTVGQCEVCHFKLSPVICFPFETFNLTDIRTINSVEVFYSKSLTSYFKGAIFSLRAPPEM